MDRAKQPTTVTLAAWGTQGAPRGGAVAVAGAYAARFE